MTALFALWALVGSASLAVGQPPEGQVIALRLPVAEKTVIIVPPGNLDWEAFVNANRDYIRSTSGSEVLVSLSYPPNPLALCATGFKRGSQPGAMEELVDSPPYIAENWHPRLFQSSDATKAMACADKKGGGVLVAVLTAEGELALDHDSVAPRVRGLLESLGYAFETRRLVPSDGSP